MPQVPMVKPDGEAVRWWRTHRGLTTPKLGKMIGRDGSSIRHIETKSKPASEVLINQIANALKVDVSKLLKPDELIKPDEHAENEPNGKAA